MHPGNNFGGLVMSELKNLYHPLLFKPREPELFCQFHGFSQLRKGSEKLFRAIVAGIGYLNPVGVSVSQTAYQGKEPPG